MLSQAILDSVSEEIAVLDNDGIIIAVNDAWRRFSIENGTGGGKPSLGTEVGANYLAACKKISEGKNWENHCGIRAVLDHRLPCFSMEYPCHSPKEKRWYRMNVTPLKNTQEGCVITHVNITERKIAEEERMNYLNQIKEVSRHFVSAQENARRRLSHELHDRTSSNLAAINLNLDIIARDFEQNHLHNIQKRLEDTRALLEDTTLSIREISLDLRPPLLDYAGLVAAMQSYGQQFEKRTGINVISSLPDSTLKFTPELENLLFRIFQEALTNCAKHAKASSVSVSLGGHESSSILSVSDNGAGFDTAQLHQRTALGIGLLNMRELAEVAGCQLLIKSRIGEGTTIEVKFRDIATKERRYFNDRRKAHNRGKQQP